MLNRIFSDMVTNVGNNIQDTSDAMKTIIKVYCNDVYFDILRRINWECIDDDYQFTTVAGTKDYSLPPDFGKELYVYDSTNKVQLSPIDLQQLSMDFTATIDTQGTVQRYLTLDRPVRQQPSSASTLSIVSSSAADTSQVVRIKGLDSNGVELNESVTLAGTSTATSANTYSEIKSLSKSASTTGRITITSNSGAVTVAIMSPADLSYRVKIMRLHESPSSAIVVKAPYIVKPYPLSSDYDTPVIECADVIELGATMKAWRYKRQFDKAKDMKNEYEQAISNIVWDKENSFNQAHYLRPTPYPRED